MQSTYDTILYFYIYSWKMDKLILKNDKEPTQKVSNPITEEVTSSAYVYKVKSYKLRSLLIIDSIENIQYHFKNLCSVYVC